MISAKKINFKPFFQLNFGFFQLTTVNQKVVIRFRQPNQPDLFVAEPKVIVKVKNCFYFSVLPLIGGDHQIVSVSAFECFLQVMRLINFYRSTILYFDSQLAEINVSLNLNLYWGIAHSVENQKTDRKIRGGSHYKSVRLNFKYPHIHTHINRLHSPYTSISSCKPTHTVR